MTTFKKFLVYMFGGAILGMVAASLLGLSFIPWYNAPGSGAQSMLDSNAFARNVIQSFIQGQLIGAGVGSVLMLMLGITLHRSSAKKAAAQSALSASAGPLGGSASAATKAAVKDGPAPM